MGQVEIGRIPLSPEIVIAGSIYIVDLFRFLSTRLTRGGGRELELYTNGYT